jgi:subtilisin family serine protease
MYEPAASTKSRKTKSSMGPIPHTWFLMLTRDHPALFTASGGVFYSVAAANEGRNACNYSPAPARGPGSNNDIVTTPATDSPGVEPSWSNYGSCVDIWASRKRVRSTRNGGTTTLISGTSMASPHVGGTGALYLSSKPLAAPATVESALKSDPVRTGEKSEDGRRIRLVYAGGY